MMSALGNARYEPSAEQRRALEQRLPALREVNPKSAKRIRLTCAAWGLRLPPHIAAAEKA